MVFFRRWVFLGVQKGNDCSNVAEALRGFVEEQFQEKLANEPNADWAPYSFGDYTGVKVTLRFSDPAHLDLLLGRLRSFEFQFQGETYRPLIEGDFRLSAPPAVKTEEHTTWAVSVKTNPSGLMNPKFNSMAGCFSPDITYRMILPAPVEEFWVEPQSAARGLKVNDTTVEWKFARTTGPLEFFAVAKRKQSSTGDPSPPVPNSKEGFELTTAILTVVAAILGIAGAVIALRRAKHKPGKKET